MADWIQIVVCGAHMRDLPLNHQIKALGAEWVADSNTTADYRLFKLRGFEPARPGMIRTHSGGHAIAVEIWRIPIAQYGRFVALIPSPLGIATISLTGGESLQGFVCEGYATEDATDISHVGSWRAYLNSL